MTKRPRESEKEFTGFVTSVAHAGGWRRQAHFADSRKQIRTKDGRLILVGDNQAKGWPDWVFVHEGRGLILFAELKASDGVLEPEQKEWLNALRLCGLAAYAWWPKDRDEITEVFLRPKKIH